MDWIHGGHNTISLTLSMHKSQHSLFFFLPLLVSLGFGSCINSKKVTYFNDVLDSARIVSQEGIEPVIQKNDLISISISSLSREATDIFNSPNFSASPNQTGNLTSGYVVNLDGSIKFPVLGTIFISGMTKQALEAHLSKILVDKKLLFDPVVTIRFLNFRVTVLGEVNKPGVIEAPSAQISILEALGRAGDLTIYGVRENVILIRHEGAEKKIIRLNLNSSQLLQSPYYFLKSNDVVYVEPSKSKAAVGERSQQLLPIVLSGLSLLVVLVTALTN